MAHSQTVLAGNGWNLLGNTTNSSINVSTTFSALPIQSVWKWGKSTSKWQFYSPTLVGGGAQYAMDKGYEFLTIIEPGEGFWVNASSAFSLPLGQSSTSTATVRSSLVKGWNLVAIGDNRTPRSFNRALSSTALLQEIIPVSNLATLWAWDNAKMEWYFYSPKLDVDGTLLDYINSKNYLDFGTSTLSPGMGFWVNSLITGNIAPIPAFFVPCGGVTSQTSWCCDYAHNCID